MSNQQVAAAHDEAGEIAQPLFNQALEAIKKTSPHFVPAAYKCVWIADGQPTTRSLTFDPYYRRAGISEDDCALAWQYRDEQVKFCLENRFDDIQRSDVLIVITGFDSMNESVTQTQMPILYWDASTKQLVCPDEAKTTGLASGLVSHCYFQSALK